MGWLLVPQYPAVGSIRICIADGSSSHFEKHLVQWRLAEPATNIGWSAWVTEEAISRPSLPSLCRLSHKVLPHLKLWLWSGTTSGGAGWLRQTWLYSEPNL